MNEATLAVVGLSLGAGSSVGWWARGWRSDRVPRGHRPLLRHFYTYVDDRIGATKKENLRRATRRFRVIHKRDWYWWLVPQQVRRAIADYFWAVPQLGTGTAALPSTKRMGRYVQLTFRGDDRKLWNVERVRVWPTSEIDVHVHGFEASLARWVAWAMRLKSPDQLEIKAHPELGYWDFTRKGEAPERPTGVPVGVNADA